MNDLSGRILFFTSSMGCGGAQRVLAAIANHFVESGHCVAVVTEDSHENDFFELNRRIERISLNTQQASRSVLDAVVANWSRISNLRAHIRAFRPDVIVSFQDRNNILSLLASVGLRIPVIVSERNDPRMRPLPRLWRWLRGLTYRRASTIVVQTESLRAWAESLVEPDRVRVFYNPVRMPPPVRIGDNSGGFGIVAAGRLVHQKGFDLLLSALAQCAESWELTIFGSGPEKATLEGLSASLGIESRVEFAGISDDIDTAFTKAELFVLSSRYEGFPNVLVEAMACGLPVIAFDCCSGPAEIIRHEVDGLLVEPGDVSGLSRAIDRLMTNAEDRASFGARARDVLKRFSSSVILGQWTDLVERSITDRRKERGQHAPSPGRTDP